VTRPRLAACCGIGELVGGRGGHGGGAVTGCWNLALMLQIAAAAQRRLVSLGPQCASLGLVDTMDVRTGCLCCGRWPDFQLPHFGHHTRTAARYGREKQGTHPLITISASRAVRGVGGAKTPNGDSLKPGTESCLHTLAA